MTETALFSLRRYGAAAQLRFLESIASGELEVLELEPGDHRRIAELCEQYQDLPLGQVDASVVALAERCRLQAVASLDRRHFGIVRTKDGTFLELLP